ncbi:DUF3306 domain-containing protein [Thalassospiraceae bacterium LMO-JJ14]|nr:DUF3306 domain-containing protein [Thalassospiraceae bacterium LMO-JJ14]
MAEGRLSRWSRLKAKGGADAIEETQVQSEKARSKTAAAEPADPFATLPGGARSRHFVPAMVPLAPDPEDGDDRLTRGVGYLPADEDTDGEADQDAVAAAMEDDTLFAGIDEEDMSDEERETVAALAPLDSLDKDSDFTPFLRKGVPEFMKRRALRVMWRINPFFNVRDGLNDYDEDFNIIDRIIDGLTGNYQVGRGHLSEKELRDMMPEQARKAFDDDDAEEDAAEGAENDGVLNQKTPQNDETPVEIEDDEIGGSEDDTEN